jgi:predicted RNA-binding Zn-ribbon protein involved in translation (DUF1610 family)
MSNILPANPKGKIACPKCGETAHRVKRTLQDRILSLFSARKRYHCDFCDMEEFVIVASRPDSQAKLPAENRNHTAFLSSPKLF